MRNKHVKHFPCGCSHERTQDRTVQNICEEHAKQLCASVPLSGATLYLDNRAAERLYYEVLGDE